jgi:hypothetical protein
VLRCLAGALLGLAGMAGARAESPPGCDVFWQLTPEWHSEGNTRLRVRVATAAGEVGSRDWQPAPDNPALLVGPRHLVGLGQALLPLPPALATRSKLQMCLKVEGLDDTQVLASNLHAETAGPDRLLRWQGSPALLQELVVVTGSVLLRDRQVGSLRTRLLLAPSLAERAEPLADAAAAVLAAQRRHWRSTDGGRMLVILHVDDRGAPPVAMARHQAVLLRGGSATFEPGPTLRMTLARADLRGWFRERFGPTLYEQQPDEAASAWFVDGFSLFYALRQAAAEDAWPVADYAAALTALWEQDGLSAHGPWLAMKWHTDLRAQGGEGLDPMLRQLVVPPAQARPVGRLSSPQAGHRLFAVLRPSLGDQPRRDLQGWARAPAPVLQAADLGPCFHVVAAERRVLVAPPSAACQGWLSGAGSEPARGNGLLTAGGSQGGRTSPASPAPRSARGTAGQRAAAAKAAEPRQVRKAASKRGSQGGSSRPAHTRRGERR